jgi:hypothetical protein
MASTSMISRVHEDSTPYSNLQGGLDPERHSALLERSGRSESSRPETTRCLNLKRLNIGESGQEVLL